MLILHSFIGFVRCREGGQKNLALFNNFSYENSNLVIIFRIKGVAMAQSKRDPVDAFAIFLGQMPPEAESIMARIPRGYLSLKEKPSLAVVSSDCKGNSDDPKSVNLYPELSKIILEGIKRTKFQRARIEAFLPPELKTIFKSIKGNKLPDNEDSKKLIDFIRDEIYAKLPAYYAPPKKEEADGIRINGQLTRIFMSASKSDPAVQKAIKGLAVTEFQSRALQDFSTRLGAVPHHKFLAQDIKYAITSGGSRGRDRELVAKLLCLAETMKNELQAACPVDQLNIK